MTDGDAYGNSTVAYLLCLTLVYVNAITFILLPIYIVGCMHIVPAITTFIISLPFLPILQ